MILILEQLQGVLAVLLLQLLAHLLEVLLFSPLSPNQIEGKRKSVTGIEWRGTQSSAAEPG
jgi:hypothetical protein